MMCPSARIRLAVLTAALALIGGPATAQSNDPIERFTALLVNTSNVGQQGTGTVDITVKRWTTPGEAERFLSIFREKGQDALLRAIRSAPKVGAISTPGSIGYELRYATVQPLPEGARRIILATDRPVAFNEASEQPRSRDYPFLLIDLRVDANGKGSGTLALAAKLMISNDVLVIENYGNEALRLNEVTSRR